MRPTEKHILFLIDGAADEPLASLGGRTALEVANAPCLAGIATKGALGLADTLGGLPSGTDAALLRLFGYGGGPGWGRGALEAAGAGHALRSGETVLRCNLVSFGQDGALRSYNGFDLSDGGSAALIQALQQDKEWLRILQALKGRLFPGAGFRRLLVSRDGWAGFPGPHDSLGSPMPDAPSQWQALLHRAAAVLAEESARLGLQRPVNGLWPWGGGPAPVLPDFSVRFDVRGDCMAAVPVVKGVARLAGLDVIDVPGATGRLDTDWRAKVQAALASPNPFTLLHLEAPDECSHGLDPAGKVRAIELADQMAGALLDGMAGRRFRLLAMADHGTSAQTGRHLPGPVPFALYDSGKLIYGKGRPFTEAGAAETGNIIDGCDLLDLLLSE